MFRRLGLVLALLVAAVGCGGAKEAPITIAPEQQKAADQQRQMEQQMLQQGRQEMQQQPAAQAPTQQ